jgi:hypothetical protein
MNRTSFAFAPQSFLAIRLDCHSELREPAFVTAGVLCPAGKSKVLQQAGHLDLGRVRFLSRYNAAGSRRQMEGTGLEKKNEVKVKESLKTESIIAFLKRMFADNRYSCKTVRFYDITHVSGTKLQTVGNNK